MQLIEAERGQPSLIAGSGSNQVAPVLPATVCGAYFPAPAMTAWTARVALLGKGVHARPGCAADGRNYQCWPRPQRAFRCADRRGQRHGEGADMRADVVDHIARVDEGEQ